MHDPVEQVALGPEDACALYVSYAKKIDLVREVKCEQNEEGVTIWTIISSTPFDDDVRDPVYDAQIEILQRLDRPLVDFRILNLKELPEGSEDKFIPSNARTMWKK